MKKIFALLALCVTFILLLSFNAGIPEPPFIPPFDQDSFEQDPPIVKNVWVQKLMEPLEDGRNMIMRIGYEPDDRLGNEVEIFHGDGGC